MRCHWLALFPLLACLGNALPAAEPKGAAELKGIVLLRTPMQVDAAYDRIYKALEGERFWVVFEANMGDQLARQRERLGADYNRNGVGGIRAMVFCNIDWTNNVSNADPALLALCPLHLTIYAHGGVTHVALPRLSALAEGSPGVSRVTELEAVIRGVVETALRE